MPAAMLTPDHIHAYLRHLAEDRHLAPSTLKGYQVELELLLSWEIGLHREALAKHLTFTPEGTPLAATTRNRRLAILRGFFSFLIAQGVLLESPIAGIRRAKVPRKARAALSVSELGRVIQVLQGEPPSWRRTRDATLLLLFFYSGLRLSEVRRLQVHQVDLSAGLLRAALRKGGDFTDVLLHPTLMGQLALWLQARPGERTGPLFLGGSGKPLSLRYIQRRLHELGEAAGLGVPLHPHLLRHAHATTLLRFGVPTALIQQSMNHRTLATTERYLHSDPQMLADAITRLPALPLIGAEDPPVTP